jgi:hypothetical protein
MGLLVSSTKHSRKELYQFSLISSKDRGKREYFLMHFSEVIITLIPKPDKNTTRKVQTNIPHTHEHGE